MRIAHIITRMIIGGAQENTLYNCLDLLRLHGDEVVLITGPSLGPEGSLLEQGRAGELPVIELDSLRRAIHPLKDLRALADLRRVLGELRPDVVHTHSAKGGILGRQAAWELGVPAIVHTVHGAPFHPYQPPPVRWLYRACERHAAGRCHRLISVADAMTDLMVAGGVAPREKFTTVYSGMEVEPFLAASEHRAAMRAKFGFGESDIVFVKIARLFHLKGHDDLITAAAEVVRRHRQVRFLLVGDGILRDSLERRIERLGLREHFVFAGLVDPSEIPAHLGAADALVHTSYREGLARALPQALIAGLPAVSYDVDGAREVVIDGETGCLVPAADTHRLAAALGRLAEDAAMRERLGRAGRERFTEVFRHQTMTARIREIYQSILDSAPDRDGRK
ncbi:glycosyltransferase family 4 protein [Candidatus Laterigemmans baculatus]|uniref:glycosyltransferase family 4 protein n=1 Tax=Candidatus Laterigemmans baculatus TaxID=2770505 RepID=UPI0013DAC3D5|nr:glycosyltransferase family 4 protein [Candidatus Laterigemmans baculatus]